MRVVALEEEGVFSLGRDFVDFPVISGGHIKIAGLIEKQVPDILCARREIFRRGPGGVQGRLRGIFLRVFLRIVLRISDRLDRRILPGTLSIFGPLVFFPRLGFDLVDLAIGRGRSVDHSVWADLEGLYLQFLRLKDNGCVAVGCNSVDARGRSSRGIDVSRFVGGHGPNVGGGRGVKQLERRSQFQAAGTANGHSCGSAFGEVFEFRLLPGAGAIGEDGAAHRK